MRVPFLDLKWQHEVIKDNLQKRFAEIFDNTSFVGGRAVEEFEKNFADYLGVKFAVGVANGTDALRLSLEALGIGPGDEVITIPTTFVATVSAIHYVGARPVLADIDPETRDFDFKFLERAVTPRTKAIIPVHLYGQPSEMERVLKFANSHNLRVVEDACQAHGAEYKKKKVGTFGDLSAFSFYPGKNLGAYGDGGVVVTNDEVLAERVKKLRNHGDVEKYEHDILGHNSRLDSLQAAVLEEKLKHLDAWNKKRIEIAEIYHRGFRGLKGLKVFETAPETKAVYHLYAVKLLSGSRQDFMDYLKR